MGVVNEAVEDDVGISRIADEGVPFVDGAGHSRLGLGLTCNQ